MERIYMECPQRDIMYRMFGRRTDVRCPTCIHYRAGIDDKTQTCLIQKKFTSRKPIQWQDWGACGAYNRELSTMYSDNT